jgi:hypothetical protein
MAINPLHDLISTLHDLHKKAWRCHWADTPEERAEAPPEWLRARGEFWRRFSHTREARRALTDPAVAMCANRGGFRVEDYLPAIQAATELAINLASIAPLEPLDPRVGTEPGCRERLQVWNREGAMLKDSGELQGQLRVLASLAGEAWVEVQAAGPTIDWVGDRRYHVDGHDSLVVTDTQDTVLQAFIESPAMDDKQLIARSGLEHAPRVLRQIVEKYPILAPAIRIPKSKGQGGYHVRIRRV